MYASDSGRSFQRSQWVFLRRGFELSSQSDLFRGRRRRSRLTPQDHPPPPQGGESKGINMWEKEERGTPQVLYHTITQPVLSAFQSTPVKKKKAANCISSATIVEQVKELRLRFINFFLKKVGSSVRGESHFSLANRETRAAKTLWNPSIAFNECQNCGREPPSITTDAVSLHVIEKVKLMDILVSSADGLLAV